MENYANQNLNNIGKIWIISFSWTFYSCKRFQFLKYVITLGIVLYIIIIIFSTNINGKNIWTN